MTTIRELEDILGKRIAIITPNFVVEEGAIFVGKAEINPAETSKEKK